MTGAACGVGDAGERGRGLHRGWDVVHRGHEAHPRRGDVAADRLVRLAADRSTATELTVVTADGDRVTLSATTTAHVGYAGYAHLAAGKGQAVGVAGEAVSVDASRQLQLSVDGDLSEQEQADIQTLVGLLAAGDVDGALEQARAGGALGSLAGFSLQISQTTRIQLAQAERLQVSAA